jgi:hypothetical protein
MKKPPVVAQWLLSRFTTCSSALQGDVDEEYRTGRSSSWYWRQILDVIMMAVRRDIQRHPILALRGVAIGWIVLLLIFATLGDGAAEAIAKYAWNWSRVRDGYGGGLWWPYWIAASFVSYGGFAVSAWAVVRLHRGIGMSMVTVYLGSVVVALFVAATIVELVPRPLPLPHTLFYVVSVGLPFVWHSGFILVPLVILLTGLLSSQPTPGERLSVGHTN